MEALEVTEVLEAVHLTEVPEVTEAHLSTVGRLTEARQGRILTPGLLRGARPVQTKLLTSQLTLRFVSYALLNFK